MPETKNHVSENSGLTLIELLIAMAVASVMMVVIAGAYWAQAKTGQEQQMVVEMQQNMRAALFFLERDIMMAGYDNDENAPPTATITTANANVFAFQFVNIGNTVTTITYSLYDAGGDGDPDLGRSVNGAARAAIAENIQTLEFFYTLADGRQSTDPTLLPPPGNTLADIRTVAVSILARTAAETRARDNQIYTSLSGATTGPFNDGFKRQIVTASIKCRNMIEN